MSYSRLVKINQREISWFKEVIFSREHEYVPKCGTREFILREVHGGSTVGHFGENNTYTMAKEHYYWPHMLKDI